MRLLSINAADFGTLAIREPIYFEPGINLIIGPNQAGKSTLLTLIEWSLYGIPPHSAAKRSSATLDDWSPWSGEKPRAQLTFAPELKGWPQQVRLDVPFSEYKPFLSDCDTLADISRFIEINKNGTWNLGLALLGLRREAFRGSLLAQQGELEQVLLDAGAELRKVLTADLAELVEDPERASLDAALDLLDKPTFSCEPLAPTPIQLQNLLNRAEEDLKRKRQHRELLEAKYSELEQALAEREKAEHQFSLMRGDLLQLEDKQKLFDLAAAHWRHSQVHRLRQGLRDWEERFVDAPYIKKFPFELEEQIQRWRGGLTQHREAMSRLRAKIDQQQQRRAAVEDQIKSDSQLIATAEFMPQLGELATALDLGQQELSTAEWKVKEYGEGADALTRTRFEGLEERVKPYREAIPRLLEWIDKQAQLELAREKLQARVDALAPYAKGASPALLFVAALLLVGALSCGIFGALMDAAVLGIGLAVVLLAVALFLGSTALKRRRAADQAQIELNQVLKPEQAKLAEQLKSHAYAHVEMQAQHGLSDETWQQLLHDLPEYGQLNMRLRNYADACRDRDNAQGKIDQAWSSLRYILAEAPQKPDREWLSAMLVKLEGARRRLQERLDLLAAIKDGERELAGLGRREQEEFILRLSRLLEPVGLGERVLSDYEAALRQFDTYAREARAYQDQLGLLNTAEDRARSIPMQREDYDKRVSALSSQQLQQLGGLIHDEDSFRRTGNDRRAVNERILDLRQKSDQAQVQVGRLRERIAKDEEALLALPDAQAAEQEAAQRVEALKRWERALELLKHALRELQHRLTSSLAPRVSEELQYILRQAPVPNIEAAAVGDQLDLRLRVSGAPPGLTALESLNRLSLGAKRQLALALRAAVASALGAERNAPLLLDEPLAELDDERAVDCLGFLERLGQEHQVLLTTCHQAQYDFLLRKSGIRANVIQLA